MEKAYRAMRAELFDALKARGWEILATDEEADFFASGRLFVYMTTAIGTATPAPAVMIFEFETVEQRQDFPYTEPSTDVMEPSVQDALRRIDALEQADAKRT
jgi:hypothetical protein